MKHRVFFSFHYAKDSWRAGQVRNMGVLEGTPPVSTNEWEKALIWTSSQSIRMRVRHMDGRTVYSRNTSRTVVNSESLLINL